MWGPTVRFAMFQRAWLARIVLAQPAHAPRALPIAEARGVRPHVPATLVIRSLAPAAA